MSIYRTTSRMGIRLRKALPLLMISGVLLCGSVTGQESRSQESRSQESRSSDSYSQLHVSTAYHAKETSRKSIQQISDKIDSLVKQKLSSEGLKRNKRTDDSVFVRRVYLDIIGRIPTFEETQTFLASKDKRNKRADLIDELLSSYGRTSRQFNFWADLLRLKTRLGNSLSGQPYIDFVKDSLEENLPYDEFVQEMLTASGANLSHDNGEVGYYLRDRDMPEDNMSNTIRVFLGTRLECAQCHDHPYDDWTQRQYFEMVAFTGGIDFRSAGENAKDLQKAMRNVEIPEKIRGKVNNFVRGLGGGISGSGSGLVRLPENFLGDDGEDGEIVVAREMFEGEALTGAEIPAMKTNNLKNKKKKKKKKKGTIPGSKEIGSREIYAAWLTAPDNPRFATVIANRLWKQAMGVGIIEPVDIIEDGMEGANPELMGFLAKTMVDLDFDMKQFQRAIYMSETYQASAFTDDVPDVTQYHFPGPIVRRMSAEQIWDSLLTLVVSETDVRRTDMRGNQYATYKQYEELMELSPDEIVKYAMEEADKKVNGTQRESPQKAKRKELQAKQIEFKQQLKAAKKAKDAAKVKRLMAERAKLVTTYRKHQNQFARASELSSPAPAKHFLREFGQSDREVIDNANLEPSVPQVLSMMNGMLEKNVCRDSSSLLMQKALTVVDSEECIEMVFLTMLSRKPSRKELKVWAPDFDSAAGQRNNAMTDTFSDLIWTIANSNEFIFQK